MDFRMTKYVFLIVLFCNCNNLKKMSEEQSHQGSYMSTAVGDGGLFREYLLIDDSNRVYYVLDSVSYCNVPKEKFKQNYSCAGIFKIEADSIKFAFDSCLATTSTGFVNFHGQAMEIKTRTFRKDYRQWYSGKFHRNKLSFSILTIDANNDTIQSQDDFVKCEGS